MQEARLAERVLGTVATVGLTTAVLVPLCVVGIQVIMFIRDGAWTPVSIVDGLRLAGNIWAGLVGFTVSLDGHSGVGWFSALGFRQWLDAPRSWQGLHSLCSWLPLSGSALLLGWVVSYVSDLRSLWIARARNALTT